MIKPKILHVIASLNPAHGGPSHGLMNYIPEFHNQGMSNEVLCLDSPDEDFMKVMPLPVVHALGPSIRPWAYTSKLIPWFEKNICNYEVIIIHGLWLYHGYAVNKVITRLKKDKENHDVPKVFVMCHGMLDPYFQKAAGRKLKAIRNEIYWKLIESKVINNADGILFTCEEEMNLASQTFKNYRPKKVINVGYGIQAPPDWTKAMNDAFHQTCPLVQERSFILFLSRIHEKKGIVLLIESYKKIYFKNEHTNGVNRDIPALVIAGPGMETKYGKKIKEFVYTSGMNDYIFFTGMLFGDAKWGAFYNCEAFILPSHQENFGIVIAEALACQRPVLISNKVNIWREIDYAKGGLVADDTKEGTESLLYNWKKLEVEKRKQMQVCAENCFNKNFAIKPAVTRMINALTAN